MGTDDDGHGDRHIPKDHARAKEKLRHEHEQRRDAQNNLVDTLRQYGTVVLAAVVFLPPHLVVFVFCMALVYMLMRYARPSSRRTTVPTG